jgi:hypothetical protein
MPRDRTMIMHDNLMRQASREGVSIAIRLEKLAPSAQLARGS